ncbi:MAG: hypothetical protein ACRD2A_21800, partial [Vicinamibacterales bacterium]
NWFHTTWLDAKAEDNEYIPLFLPWWQHHEYAASHIGLPVQHPFVVDSDERALAKLGVDEDHLQWRRWAIPNLAGGDIASFHQEYPATDDEAFLSTGSNVFSLEHLRECYEQRAGVRGRLVQDGERLEFVRDASGSLKVFRGPSKDEDWGQYFVAGDPTHSTGRDYACIQVINRRTFEQIAVWRGKVDPVYFADEVVRLGRWYNQAEISVEVEGPGFATIGRIISLNYPNVWAHRNPDRLPGKQAHHVYGWSTSVKRKEWMIGYMKRLILDHNLQIHDSVTYDEMRNFVILPDGAGQYGPASSEGYDDTVMALGIALVCSVSEGPLEHYEAQGFREQVEPLMEEVRSALGWETA